MNKHVFAAVITNNKAEALLRVEELYDARAFTNDLGGHAAATAATAAEPTAAAAEAATTAAAAEAAAITATAAEAAAAKAATTATAAEAAATKAAAAETAAVATTEAAAAEIVTAEAVALVAPASATIAAATLVETHNPIRLPDSPDILSRKPAPDGGTSSQARKLCALITLISDSVQGRDQNLRQLWQK
ncbi:cell wall-associated NlpC family hydrolase [Sphingomonas aerophila]|uniref:Cell wall-associated NlpC family hydrolase n=1 Tax=Sphingomonas aerophila TaxID=1344948 RepID=A0A7W9BAP1_9SPHN|nr:cell wall-associated NlpC family hydrolase [Sphingomonas aerophila]